MGTTERGSRRLLMALAIAAASCSGAGEPGPAGEARPVSTPAASGLTLVTGTGPAGAVVTLEAVAPREPPPPAASPVMDQFGLAFLPDVLLARTGHPVIFRSSEDVLHNVRVDHPETRATVFNVATPPFGSYTHTFDRPGEYQVSCDVHPAMRANLVVTDSPYAAVIDAQRTFRIPEVPPGAYTARLAGAGAAQAIPIEVKGAEVSVAFPGR